MRDSLPRPTLHTKLTPIHAIDGPTVRCSASPHLSTAVVALDLLNGSPSSLAWMGATDGGYCRISTASGRIFLFFCVPVLARIQAAGYFILAVEGMIPVRIDCGARG